MLIHVNHQNVHAQLLDLMLFARAGLFSLSYGSLFHQFLFHPQNQLPSTKNIEKNGGLMLTLNNIMQCKYNYDLV